LVADACVSKNPRRMGVTRHWERFSLSLEEWCQVEVRPGVRTDVSLTIKKRMVQRIVLIYETGLL
jgi:hypothetical protein